MKSNINIAKKIKNFFDANSPLFSTRLSLVVGVVFSFFGMYLGYLNGSLSVQTNGIIAFVDVINSLLFLNAVSRSIKTPDFSYNYGYGKYESISILLSAVMLLMVLGFALYENVTRFGEETAVESSNYIFLAVYSSITAAIIFAIYFLQNKAAKRLKMPILKYDSELWKMDGFIELGVLANLIIASILLFYGKTDIAILFDSIFAIIISVIALRVPLKGSREALNQLLDKTLPDEMQFDIIAVVAENLNDMCEFKQVHTRQSGKDIFIELDIVLPFDATIETKFGFEKTLQDEIKKIYPTAISRIYAVACDKDCIKGGTRRCPVYLKKQEAEEKNE